MLKAALKWVGLYEPVQALWYARDPPNWYAKERNEVGFYRRFIRPGSLCFDIGANVGSKAAIFRKLGARVVCAEPIPSALSDLRDRFADDTAVSIVPKAVGAAAGEASIHVGDSSTISSMSGSWVERMAVTARMAGRQWPETIMVPVTTLEELIVEFGVPEFCKIDVEGHETAVLMGLGRPLPALSFEFQPELPEDAIRCIETIENLGSYNFNYSMSSPLKLELGDWVGPGPMKEVVSRFREIGLGTWGDIYATRRWARR